MSIVSEAEIKEIAESAELVLKVCERIAELEGYIGALESANDGITIRAIAYGFNSESYDNGRLHLDLGDTHRPWVIARLKEMVQEKQAALLQACSGFIRSTAPKD